MSRRADQLRREAGERWPLLHQFLVCYLHEDRSIFHATVELAVEQAIADRSLEQRQAVLKEWRDWNSNRSGGAQDDIRGQLNDGFGVNIHFKKAVDGRDLMNMIYDKLITSVRTETESRWKP